jgi:hypothetical protein
MTATIPNQKHFDGMTSAEREAARADYAWSLLAKAAAPGDLSAWCGFLGTKSDQWVTDQRRALELVDVLKQAAAINAGKLASAVTRADNKLADIEQRRAKAIADFDAEAAAVLITKGDAESEQQRLVMLTNRSLGLAATKVWAAAAAAAHPEFAEQIGKLVAAAHPPKPPKAETAAA